MNRDLVRQIVVVLSVIATIVLNGLANGLPLNGVTTGEVSDQFDVYFVPAGYVFSIWGVIYAGLIAYAVYQGLPTQRENPRLRRIGYLFVLSCGANVGWLYLWVPPSAPTGAPAPLVVNFTVFLSGVLRPYSRSSSLAFS